MASYNSEASSIDIQPLARKPEEKARNGKTGRTKSRTRNAGRNQLCDVNLCQPRGAGFRNPFRLRSLPGGFRSYPRPLPLRGRSGRPARTGACPADRQPVSASQLFPRKFGIAARARVLDSRHAQGGAQVHAFLIDDQGARPWGLSAGRGARIRDSHFRRDYLHVDGCHRNYHCLSPSAAGQDLVDAIRTGRQHHRNARRPPSNSHTKGSFGATLRSKRMGRGSAPIYPIHARRSTELGRITGVRRIKMVIG